MKFTRYDLAQCGLSEQIYTEQRNGKKRRPQHELTKELMEKTGYARCTIVRYLATMTPEQIIAHSNRIERPSGHVYKGRSVTMEQIEEETGIKRRRLRVLMSKAGLSLDEAVRDSHKYSIEGSKLNGLKKEYRDA